MTSTPLAQRVAAAPISWGVCEVPGWGVQLTPERVLSEMRELGVVATEFGPDGFLPEAPAERATTLAAHDLRAVGGFVPVILHRDDHDPVRAVDAELDAFLAAGATRLVLSADTGLVGYDSRPELSDAEWATLLANLARLDALAASRGIVASLHPHVGTLVESASDVERVLAGSAIGICLDTGHLMIGGADPVALAEEHPERIRHVHLKDVRRSVAERVQSGELTYTDGIRAGLYTPLGDGDIDILRIVTALEGAGYSGYYVLEQDTILTAQPPTGGGPLTDVQRSLAYITSLHP